MATIKAKTEYCAKYMGLKGGINYWEPEHQLAPTETAEMKNLLWENGMLVSRKGQEWLSSAELGCGIAVYPRKWHGRRFAHINESLYMFNETGEYTMLATGLLVLAGKFFLYDEKLYYKNCLGYKVISYDEDGFHCADVTPYIPVIIINASPSTGAGDVYQPENRMSPHKTVWYNAESGVVTYKLPVVATRIKEITVDGVRTTAFSYNSQTGTVRFNTAPPVTNPATNNTVHITYELANEEAQMSIAECDVVETYGGTGALCIVMAGNPNQPNAYYWNGQDSIGMNPGYFPMEQVQLAGDNMEAVTGFGKQHGDLVIFKKNSVGKTALSTVELNGRLSIDMPYQPVNAKMGCSFWDSIQLVENNLVWANEEGIFTMLDTTPADENAIVCISRKIRGNDYRQGLEYDLRRYGVCSIDDGRRYYLTAGNRTWVWDYEVSDYLNPSWFLLTDIKAEAWGHDEDGLWHVNGEGQLTVFSEEMSDYGEPFERVYRFATLGFDSYDCFKNINTVNVILGAYRGTEVQLEYITDYETRKDLTELKILNGVSEVGSRKTSEIVPAVFRRKPHCRRVLHFGMRLVNNHADEDVEIIGAEVYYRTMGVLR